MYPRSDRQQLYTDNYMWPDTTCYHISNAPLTLVIRQSYVEANPTIPWGEPTPWCAELVRRAFADHDEAWTVVYDLVEPIIRRWVRFVSDLDQDEVIQEAFVAFYRFAPRRASLIDDDKLGRMLAYLKRCVSTTIVSLRRRERRHTEVIPLDESNDHMLYEELFTNMAVSDDLPFQIAQLQLTHREYIILYHRFLEGVPPRQIATRFPAHFANVQAVYTVVQNLKQRLRQTSAVQLLYHATFVD
ncbi:MAG: sigma-70 family RNA polymerase sigma factor [Chloroflexota bacterium]